MSKVHHLSPKSLANIRRGLGRSWAPGGSHDLRFRHNAVDADTLRRRALEDRRGQLYATLSYPTLLGPRYFRLLWSIVGRVDQLDVFDSDGAKVITCRLSAVLNRLSALLRGVHTADQIDA